MAERFVEAMGTEELLDGGMKAVEAGGLEIVVCKCRGRYYAVERRCGHMNAPLERGTLDGTILTCPMHFAQFDVATGEALSEPVPRDFGKETPPPRIARFLEEVGRLMGRVKTCSIRRHETKIEGDTVLVLVEPATP